MIGEHSRGLLRRPLGKHATNDFIDSAPRVKEDVAIHLRSFSYSGRTGVQRTIHLSLERPNFTSNANSTRLAAFPVGLPFGDASAPNFCSSTGRKTAPFPCSCNHMLLPLAGLQASDPAGPETTVRRNLHQLPTANSFTDGNHLCEKEQPETWGAFRAELHARHLSGFLRVSPKERCKRVGEARPW